MFIFLSKFLPLFVYPLGLGWLLALAALGLRGRPRLRNALLLGGLAILWLGSNRFVAFSLARSLEWRHVPQGELPQAGAIVVLGGATEPGQAPRPMVELNSAGDRVLYAAQLYRQGKAPRIVLSGGKIDWLGAGSYTPAEDMAGLLVFMGLPESDLLLQTRSRNTHEDARFTHELLAEQGIDRILLVTSAMHMPRSLALFEHEGVEVIPAPADFTVTQASWDDLWRFDWQDTLLGLMPSAGNLSLTTNVLKEYIGMFVYRLQGWM